MPKALDITGQKFNSLTAIRKEQSKSGKTYWLFRCDCGKEVILQTQHVVNGTTKSCGCLSTNRPQIKVCEICGEKFETQGFSQSARKYCFQCSPPTNNPTAKITAMRNALIKARGGCCSRCGYNKCFAALEFHHRDPSTKDFQLANNGGVPSFERLKEEADKCDLLCANCHREEHERLRQENSTNNL